MVEAQWETKEFLWNVVGGPSALEEGRLTSGAHILATVAADAEYGWIWQIQDPEIAGHVSLDASLGELVRDMPLTGFASEKELARLAAQEAFRAIWNALGARVANI